MGAEWVALGIVVCAGAVFFGVSGGATLLKLLSVRTPQISDVN